MGLRRTPSRAHALERRHCKVWMWVERALGPNKEGAQVRNVARLRRITLDPLARPFSSELEDELSHLRTYLRGHIVGKSPVMPAPIIKLSHCIAH